jgi:tRNA(Ile)-lysidine synthase
MPAFREKVERLIREERLIAPQMRVVVGISGGADSVALLSVLKEIAPPFSLKIHAAHLNHLLRDEAAADAVFVRRLAQSMDIPLTVGYARVARLAETRRMSIEEAGRLARYKFLIHVARRVGAQRIAVGHHTGDQVETVIFNFMRGAGPSGIAGIPARNRLGVIRPLLEVSRGEIEDYCRGRGLTWRVDATNLSTDYRRNRIRGELLPYLRRFFNPQVDRAIAQTAEIVSQENRFLEHLTIRIWRQIAEAGPRSDYRLPLAQFAALPLVLQRRLLRKLICGKGYALKDFGYQNYSDCLNFLQKSRPGGELHLPHGLRLIKNSRYFTVVKGLPPESVGKGARRILKIPGTTEIPELGLSISAEIKPYRAAADCLLYLSTENYQECFDYDKIKLPLVVRTRLTGDRIRPFGLKGTKKVKDLFNDFKVPLHQRDSVPLVASDAEIYWAVGYRRGAAAPVTQGTERVLLLKAHLANTNEK